MVSYICNLHHKQGRGPDAFLLNQDNEIIKSIEIKATITKSGFQEIKNEQYDELYWLRFHEHEKLEYEIYRFTREKIEQFLEGKNNRKVNLIGLICEDDKPIAAGKIGFIIK
jgi:phosphorylcholine metabolism protein LicD